MTTLDVRSRAGDESVGPDDPDVYGNTYRHPAVLANMAVTADHISGGRFILGVGAGWQKTEHREYGIPLPPTRELIDRLTAGHRATSGRR